jgi:hypothetical protein
VPGRGSNRLELSRNNRQGAVLDFVVARWLGVLRGWDLLHWREAVRWRVLVGVYIVVAVAALVAVNADQSNAPAALGLVGAASGLLGWGTRSAWGAVLAWMLVPVALVFGDANRFTGGGAPDPVVLLALEGALISTVVIMLAAGVRTVIHRRHVGGRLTVRKVRQPYEIPGRDGPSVTDLRRVDERPRPARDRGAQKRPTRAHPTGHRR